MKLTVNADTWPLWSRNVAYPADPTEYCEASVERLMVQLSDYVTDVKNVRPQFKAINSIRMISFETAADKAYYDAAYERYLEATAKLLDSGGPSSKFAIMVEWLKFRQAAELVRVGYTAREMYRAVKEGFAVVGARCFKPTMAKETKILVEQYGVPRSQISLIWGGSASFVGREAKCIPQAEIMNILGAAMRGEWVDTKLLKQLKQQLTYDSEGIGELSNDLDLGPQDFRKRQEEIDKFQSGQAHYCLFNFKSGGIGLSLHHSDDMTKEKCRRKKESGYVYLEDIPKIPTRPRLTFLTPTFSAIELVQGLGRAARITSLSDTRQILLFFRGTIEERVASVVSQKLKCLKKVVRQRESWEDIILQGRDEQQKQLPAPVVIDEDIDGSDLFELDDGGEDDDDPDDPKN